MYKGVYAIFMYIINVFNINGKYDLYFNLSEN